jgi:hypothetical protein
LHADGDQPRTPARELGHLPTALFLLAMTEGAATSRAALRTADFEDCIEASALMRRLGLSISEEAGEVRRVWTRLWRDNPAVAYGDEPQRSPGWILHQEGRIVGFFGNIPLRYQFGEEPLVAANASMWGVEKGYRGQTKDLATAYFSQRAADFLLVTTAIKPTARLFGSYEASPIPVRTYDQVLYWVLNPDNFLKAALTKKNVRLPLAKPAISVVSPALKLSTAALGHRLGRHAAGLMTHAIALTDVGDDFDQLWRAKIKERPRLMASRSAADIRWHFDAADKKGRVSIIVCKAGAQPRGYIVVLTDRVDELGFRRAKIADMLAVNDASDVVNTLLAAANDRSIEHGCDVIEMTGFPSHIREMAMRFRPMSRRLPVFPFHYKVIAPRLAEPLASESHWYPTLFDGDSSLG